MNQINSNLVQKFARQNISKMPKRGGQRNNYNNNGNRFGALNYSDEHDDRAKDRTTTRRVSFKPSGLQQNKGGLKSRLAEMAIKSRLEDDDDMSEFIGSRFDSGRSDRGGGGGGGGRRKGSPIPRGKFGFKKLVKNYFGWYQVTINYGQKYNKDELIRQILDTIAPEIFIPHYWRTEKHCIVFYVDDFRIAEILQSSDRNIQMYDGFKLTVRVRPGTPAVTIDEPYKEKIKLAMVKRYNVNTRALDLSRFHADPDFKDVFVTLARPQIMTAVLDIIEKNIPDLVALNLNDNQMSTMESFKNMTQRLPHLHILYLDENRIPSVAHLLVFRNAHITELALKSNPLRSRYKDQSFYISDVRKKFPKLTKLDGVDLEPQILFDVNDTATLPQPKASFLCDAAGADIIRQFLEQYFIIFDSDNRQPLLEAYHEQAMLTIALPPISQSGRLSAFSKFNHNLKWLNMNNDNCDKSRLLKYGRLPVVSTFTEWPKTQHDPQSFTVDLTLFTPKLISFTVAGLFKEFNVDSGASTSHSSSNNDNTEIRYFQRQLVIVPAGGGFCIRNELIFLTSANYAQVKKAFKPVAAAPVTNSPVGLPPIPVAGGLQNRLQVNQPSTSQAAAAMMAPQIAAGSITPDETTKLQMIQAMSAQSSMNLEWSRKCLEETNWDYNHAAFVFDKLQKESKIPPEAFVK